MEDFIAIRDQLINYITDKGLISELIIRSQVGRSTVYRTFEAESEDELKGKTLKVWNSAIELVKESKTAVPRAAKALRDE